MQPFLRSIKFHFVLLGLACLLSFESVQAELIIKKPHKQKRYAIENQNISESSGLACSTRDKQILWTHNDSGHMPIIYAMDNKGKDIGTFHLDGLEAIDWEDMDAFQYQGNHYLLIADSGDNYRMLLGHRISIIKEPKLTTKQTTRSAISPEWSFLYRFEDGQSYDVESVAVDIQREKIILLSKRNKPTLMFELPLMPADIDLVQVAKKIDKLPDIINPSALDISSDGHWMSINTYRRIHRFYREHVKKGWHYEHSLKYKKLFQPEAMCLSKNNKKYYVTSEKQPYLLKIEMNSN